MANLPMLLAALAGAPLDPDLRLPDGGLPYAETRLDQLIKEPWNTASLLPFLAIIVYWVWRLRGDYRRHAFLIACMPIMAVSLVGGILYHGTRSSPVWLVMDWLPILLLVLVVSIFCWRQVLPRYKWLAFVIPLAYLALSSGVWRGAQLPIQTRINLNYTLMGTMILIPLGILLVRTRGYAGQWVALALACFAAAVACRALDRELTRLLPMGTHWLWHLFGAGATAALAHYLYRFVERRAAAAPLASVVASA